MAGDHLSVATVRPLKALGLVGYAFALITVALIGATIAAAAADTALTAWIVATVICAAITVACLGWSRTRLQTHYARDRPQHDPLIPETTAEEVAEYEEIHHPRRRRRR
ncbi:hypothetical protein [Gordonia neofelifaecis]|uniref:Transmembrane protein n=1 Tax=Gordonia neofelifaecis NRRL B-59395 TaxID=644548 RepID=F1YM85_9ACTN|nr:hypothetical protein [Gordonia neofelifaecis]EGD54134.1 hypothetical protein SCNU_15469 [Gordonia neofelifaecis NRRL B-59395]